MKIKPFEEFIFESDIQNKPSDFLTSILTNTLPGTKEDKETEDQDSAETEDSENELTSFDVNSDNTLARIPGNDEYIIYLQHQQGVGGASSLVNASKGNGKIHPSTIESKLGKKYANLVGNFPISKEFEEKKKKMIKALDSGDHKKAAKIFLNVWKERWETNKKLGLKKINEPAQLKVKQAIQKAAKTHKIPYEFAVTTAMIESSLNPKAQNAKYKGLYALDPNSSYDGKIKAIGSDWDDPIINADRGLELIKKQVKILKKNLGIAWNDLDLGDLKNVANA